MSHNTRHQGNRLSREERTARAAARFTRGADMPPASTMAPSELAQAETIGAMPSPSLLEERVMQAIGGPALTPVLRARTRLALGLAIPAGDDHVLGLRIGEVSMQTARTPRPIELTLAADATLPLSTPDLLLTAWHVLRRVVACLVLATTDIEAFADTAIVDDADPRATDALARAVLLSQVGGCEIAVLPVAFDDAGLQLGGALQLVRGPDATEALTFTLALSQFDGPVSGEIDPVIFVQDLFVAYGESAFALLGAYRR